MTTLFLLVTWVCQSLNELGVASVTKKWSGQNRTSRTACYGPARVAVDKGSGNVKNIATITNSRSSITNQNTGKLTKIHTVHSQTN